MFIKKIGVAASLLSLIFGPAISHAENCQPIAWESGRTYKIEAEPHKFTHIILPENILRETNPIVGNSALWDKDSAGPHVFIKPNSELKQGSETTLSIIGESGRSYDFIVGRTNAVDVTCYVVKEGVLFDERARGALSAGGSGDSSGTELAALWRDKYMSEKIASNEKLREAVSEALRRYRYHIYTRYDWSKGRGFIGKNLISDVYDDGRFTYIRVSNQNKGIMMVEAELADQVEIIEAKYDPDTRIYTVAGIFPEFTLKYGKTKVAVNRDDNNTAGEY